MLSDQLFDFSQQFDRVLSCYAAGGNAMSVGQLARFTGPAGIANGVLIAIDVNHSVIVVHLEFGQGREFELPLQIGAAYRCKAVQIDIVQLTQDFDRNAPEFTPGGGGGADRIHSFAASFGGQRIGLRRGYARRITRTTKNGAEHAGSLAARDRAYCSPIQSADAATRSECPIVPEQHDTAYGPADRSLDATDRAAADGDAARHVPGRTAGRGTWIEFTGLEGSARTAASRWPRPVRFFLGLYNDTPLISPTPAATASPVPICNVPPLAAQAAAAPNLLVAGLDDDDSDTSEDDEGARQQFDGGSGPNQASMQEQVQLATLRELRRLRKPRDDSDSDGVGASKFRGLHKARQRLKRHPRKFTAKYRSKVMEECRVLGVAHWSFRGYILRCKQSFGHMVGLWRTWY